MQRVKMYKLPFYFDFDQVKDVKFFVWSSLGHFPEINQVVGVGE